MMSALLPDVNDNVPLHVGLQEGQRRRDFEGYTPKLVDAFESKMVTDPLFVQWKDSTSGMAVIVSLVVHLCGLAKCLVCHDSR